MQAAAPFSQSHRYSVVIVPAIHRAGIFLYMNSLNFIVIRDYDG
jgi:hypothetical protein